ncbi:MAG: hypothetical protein IKP14_01745 [Clostridiales bacterium]|nr:hypothetical protein [Clostridiales bacterium]
MEKKHGLMLGGVGLILLAVYNLLVFVIFSDFNNVFWTSYAFALIAFALCAGCFFYSLKNVSIKAIFFGIPLMSFSLYFLILETVVSFIMMGLKDVVSIKLAVVVQVLILAAFLIVAIISVLGKDVAVQTSEKISNSAKYVQSFRVDLEGCAMRCQDPAAKAAIEKLAETARYADQRSTPAVASIEQQISATIGQIQQAVNSGNYQEIPDLCQQAQYAYSDRDRRLRLG